MDVDRLFFLKEGIMQKELKTGSKTAIAEFYIQILEELLKGISIVTPQFWGKDAGFVCTIMPLLIVPW